MNQMKKVFRFKSAFVLSLLMIMFAIMMVSNHGCGSSSAPHAVVFKFAVTDDSRAAGGAAAKNNGVATVVLGAIAKDIATQGVDFVLFPGDMVTGDTQDTTALSSMLDTWKTSMAPVYNAKIPVYTTRGNHEYNTIFPANGHGQQNPTDSGRATYLAHFPMPTNGPTSGAAGISEVGLTYSFTWKNAKIIGFDQYAGRTTTYNDTLYAPGSNKGQAMNSWVLDQINNSTSGVNFVMSHEQIWPTTSQPDCLANDPDSRDALVHALGTHNGTYLSGHNHMYVRGAMTNAGGDKVPAFTIGTAGGGNYDYAPFDVVKAGYTGPDKYNVQNVLSDSKNPTFGYMVITVYADNTWSAEFRGFQFNHWNNSTDVSLTPISVMDAFKSGDVN